MVRDGAGEKGVGLRACDVGGAAQGLHGARVPPDELMAHRVLRGIMKLFGRRL